MESNPTKKLIYLSSLTAAGLSLFVFETLIPHPLPWVRLGLGNMAWLLALLLFGWKEAYLVTILKAILGTLILGTFMTPTSLFALAGGIAAVTATGAVYRAAPHLFSIVGLSVIGAVTHNITQLLMAYGVLVRRPEIFAFTWTFILSGFVMGILTGSIAHLLLVRLESIVAGTEEFMV